MCGICGFTKADEGDRKILSAMCAVMAHRGPDGEGLYVADGIALGHRRLALIDMKGGSQPMVRATGQRSAAIWSPARIASGAPCADAGEAAVRGDYAIVFNGEIYNYRDLRTELSADGWEFTTDSDTEVLLVGYLAWGEAVLDRLRGMFAFAIWNRATRELFCARDFFGIKPFYYTQQQGHFIFASEIKSILEHPAYRRRLNEDALAQYLCFQFSALPETFFKGVFKLLPGHYLRVHADGSVSDRRYWHPTFAVNRDRSEDETVRAIDAAMRESVRYHNVADVEVGSFLSSGIDSSYLAACLAKENPAIHTFTVGFSLYEGNRDEVSWAKELACQLGIANASKHIRQDEYWDAVARVQWHMDEPSADPSAVSLYFVDQLAARQVKAVLSGEGADELFGGYRVYQAPLASRRLAWAPSGLLRAVSQVARALGVRGANYLERASGRVEDWYYTNANDVSFSVAERDRLLLRRPHVPDPQQVVAPAYAEVAGLDDVTRMQRVDLSFWLVGDILLKTDKMAMAHSLESRVPFLDKKVFELAATLPVDQKVSSDQTKIALREAAERAIPRDWAQKRKLGFPTPIAVWLREEPLYGRVRRAFTSPEALSFFDVHVLLKLLDDHKAGKADNSRKIWIVYAFLVWYRVFFVDCAAPQVPAAR
jgi:asparagine synthase (glutamine-hydrolysing)